MNRNNLIGWIFLVICTIAAPLHAQNSVKVKGAQGRWQVSEEITLKEAEERAFMEAKKEALRKAGVMENVWSVFGQISQESGTEFHEAYSQMNVLAIELDRPELYTSYLNMNFSDWLSQYWASNQLSWHPLSRLQLTRLYIGNQFCHLLFPEEDLLFTLMDKTWADGLAVTLSFSYLREFMLKPIQQLLETLNFWCQKHQRTVEIVVNDWAMADLLTDFPHLHPILGVLINKRRKDPRLSYKKGELSALSENSINADFYRNFLAETCRVTRYEEESCGYLPELPEGKHSLHLPFYQTNTSQYCPLYARCKRGSRGAQTLPKDCPHWCREYAFLYPAHLHMLGRYNSLFALDTGILRSPELLGGWLREGVDRLVVNLL